MKFAKDLTGNKFNRLTVLGYSHRTASRKVYWKCKCDCGRDTVATTSSLNNSYKKSCGCLQREAATRTAKTLLSKVFRITDKRFNSVWSSMIQRCTNPNSSVYKNYGGRGIKVCDEWRSFENFYNDMFESYNYGDKLTIERIDVNGNYEPSNCRWATSQEQGRNKRKTKYYQVGKEKLSLLDLMDKYNLFGIDSSVLRRRLKEGQPLLKSLELDTFSKEERLYYWDKMRVFKEELKVLKEKNFFKQKTQELTLERDKLLAEIGLTDGK